MQNKPVVVKVFNGNPYQSGQFIGTAFFISSRYLLSAAHVCNACDDGIFLSELPKGGNLKVPDDNIHPCSTSHGKRDVVIIEFPRDDATIPDLPLLTQKISENTAVHLYGYDHKDQPINELESSISGYVNSYHSWKMQGSIAKGLSGGAVTSDNKLLGVIYARDSDKNIAYCIPVDEIKKCLDDLTTVVQSSIKPTKLYGVPQLPAHYMLREDYLNSFRETLLKGDASKVGITGRYIGVQGMGGIGKSILANALAHDESVQQAFPDGIFWLQFRQQITKEYLLERQKEILHSLQCEQVPYSLSQGKNLLDLTLQDKHCLLIIDDIWDNKHIKHFDINNTNSRYLLTTRNSALLADIGAITCPVDLLSEVDALNLLAIYSGYSFNDLPAESKEIVKKCGFLPLAIAAIGSMVKNKPVNRWKLALKKLKNAELDKIATTFDYDHNNLFKAFQVSVEALPKEVQEYYKTLVIFPEDVQIPESVLEILWDYLDLGVLDPLDIIDQLVEASLFSRIDDDFLIDIIPI